MKQSIILLAAIFLLGACATSKQARYLDNEGTGFLSDYSQLKEGTGDEALRVYKNPLADWRKYSEIIIDPVALKVPRDSDISSMTPQDRQAFVNYFYATLQNEFGKSLRLVRTPSSRAIRAQVAITTGDSSNLITDTLSTVIPFSLALSTLKDVAVGRPIGVGAVQVEAQFFDSVTGQRLAAGIDRRVGGKSLSGKFDKWEDARDSFDFWATQWHKKFVELRG